MVNTIQYYITKYIDILQKYMFFPSNWMGISQPPLGPLKQLFSIYIPIFPPPITLTLPYT